MKKLVFLFCGLFMVAARADYVEDEVLVKPKQRVQLAALAQQLGLELIRESYPIQRYRIPAAQTVPAVVQLLNESGFVHWAEPDPRV